ncbi:hypothetical protein ABVK25_008728 [Lepraria finkii]|uniref:Hydrophobin n=1 Tax=Lepraria finkii TaxID=1340010 RepID=A0ABR4AZA0_9LECA
MQFQSIIAVLAMAVAVTAAPSPNPPSPPPQCEAGQTTACCPSTFTGGEVPIGVTCTVVSLLNILNPSCPSTQQLACCNTGTQQNNVIAIGTVCAPISV